MKTQIKKLVKSAVFGVTVLGGAVAMQSFGEAFQEQTWYYNSDDPNEINVASNWTMTNPGLSGCSSANLPLPCQLPTPEEVDNQSALADHFDEVFNNDASSITAAATQRRNP
ncbi:hypothetical protein [Sphingobacterium haloxyli]|uniref:Uncharacterized protein n=1 Tax=Sphingobacterium haloxyli TaxID=2100533 RepID=A0A2S9J5L4_9SPHI|nr:hypothetical protein [Sphingobacterium haloxyli]PRD48034.1 hypothetical protein C5745_05845 [Sphingobacterium haloxyli]